jgi:hypothetical protein
MKKTLMTMSKEEIKREGFKLELQGLIENRILFSLDKALNKGKIKVELNNDDVYIIK